MKNEWENRVTSLKIETQEQICRLSSRRVVNCMEKYCIYGKLSVSTLSRREKKHKTVTSDDFWNQLDFAASWHILMEIMCGAELYSGKK